MSVCKKSKINSNSRLALIIGFYPLGTSSVLINLIEMLNQSGVYVDIYINQESLNIPYSPPSGNVSIFTEPYKKHFKIINKLYYYILKIFLRNSLLFKVIKASYNYFWFAVWVSGMIKKHSFYNAILYANFSSIYVSSFLKEKIDTSIYYNLELLDDNMAGETHWNEIREIERIHLKYMDWVFATSKKRGECFQKLTDFPSDQIRVLPVLSLSGEVPKSSRYFYDKFSLSDNIKIVLLTGSISKRLLQLEIINTVKYWPSDTALIFHTWDKEAFNNGYGLSLREAAQELPVYFSGESLSYNDITSAISSARIGLAFYDDLDTNLNEILFSSNKIIEYLRCGLPVITSYNSDLNVFFNQNKCGLSVYPEDLPKAITAILDNYIEYRNAAFNTSKGNFSFENYFYNAFTGINLLIKR